MKKPITLLTALILAFATIVLGQNNLPEYSPNYLPFDMPENIHLPIFILQEGAAKSSFRHFIISREPDDD